MQRQEWASCGYGESGKLSWEEYEVGKNIELAYVLVIQVRAGDAVCKVIVETSLERVSGYMLHEAVNGYSIIFSVAILKPTC
jgi:hypothetical protein